MNLLLDSHAFRWFVGMHYKFNKKLDTPFWKFANENTNIGDAQMVIDLFKQRPPLSASNFGTFSPYTALEALVFNSYSYDTLLFGQKVLNAPLAKPAMSKEDYLHRTLAYQELTKKSLTLHELFSNNYFFTEGLLEQLFDGEANWITDTEA